MRKLSLIAALSLLALTGCAQSTIVQWLEGHGVSASVATKAGTVASDAVEVGTLFCQIDTAVAAVPNVSVIGASATAVAAACKQATLLVNEANASVKTASVPVPPPTPAAAVPIATVPATAAAAVVASVPPTPPT